jgi:DNA-binding LacI/PurR family transcriptional regulator
LLHKLGHKRCPTGLMCGADARAAVAIEVLRERDEMVPGLQAVDCRSQIASRDLI